jgi:hypothetical protein
MLPCKVPFEDKVILFVGVDKLGKIQVASACDFIYLVRRDQNAPVSRYPGSLNSHNVKQSRAFRLYDCVNVIRVPYVNPA